MIEVILFWEFKGMQRELESAGACILTHMIVELRLPFIKILLNIICKQETGKGVEQLKSKTRKIFLKNHLMVLIKSQNLLLMKISPNIKSLINLVHK